MDIENRYTMEPMISLPPVEIHNLPDEILLDIFSHLCFEDLAQTAYVCRRWHRLVKGRKSLWRRKEFTTEGPMKYRWVLRVTTTMPRLKSVRLIFGMRFGVHIVWPEATVVLNSAAPTCPASSRWVLPTDMLLVSRFVADDVKDFLKWVKTQHLRLIHVGEQCFASITDSRSPFRSYVQRRHCNLPDCLLHSKNPSFYQVPFSRRKVLPSPRMVLCPALEQLSIHCVYLSQKCLMRLCSLGPMRVLHVMCRGLQSLSFLNHCATTQLEVLSVRESHVISTDPFNDLLSYLGELKHLKVLELSCKPSEEGKFRSYVKDMRHLDIIIRHTHEFFERLEQDLLAVRGQ